jgi:ketosteroid isomerase-like protein
MEDERIHWLRRNYEAYNRCDFDSVVERAHPDMVVVRAGGQGEIRGPQAVRAWMEPDAFESQVLEPLAFQAAADKVLVYARGRLRGAGSGIEMEVCHWAVWSFDDEARITRIEIFLDHEEADARRALESG